MIQIPAELSGLALQAWLLSVTGVAMGATKIALWVKGSGSSTAHTNGNGKLMLAKDEGRFEVQILSLTERVVRLNELMHKTQKEDREKWAPMLAQLMESQTYMMETLDQHNSLAGKHRERILTIWNDMLGAFNSMNDKMATLPCIEEGKKP